MSEAVSPPPAASPPLLRLDGISKRFGPLLANDAISLELRAGEVLALLGENGAGKSTLVSILFGHQRADAGRIEMDGVPLAPGAPRAALAAGIGMVHQHFTLADNLSVLDNLLLGREPLWRLRSRRAAARLALLDAAQRFGLAVDADARVAELTVGQRQRVEILKALLPFGDRPGARVLILDEPTAVLTPQESEALFATLQRLVSGGLALIFISHKLGEVLRVADRIAVLRAGKLVATLPAAGADQARLAELMVGRELQALRRPHASTTAVADAAESRAVAKPACVLRGASVRRRRGLPPLEGVDLALHAGEVVGIAGVSGNGQQTLADLLCGMVALDAGTLDVAARALPPKPAAWVEAGVARVPEDRLAVGSIGELPLWANAVLERFATPAFSRLGVLRLARARAHAQRVVERFDVRGTQAHGIDTLARRLSGGNLQKLILGRALLGDPDDARVPPLIVASQPTWGLDVGAVGYVHQQLLDAAARGAAVLVISDDLDELFALCSRIAVMHRGRLSAPRAASAWTLAQIGLAMAGQDAATPAASSIEAAHG